MDNGVRENEMCPVFVAVTDESLRPAPDEVAGTAWVGWSGFRDEVLGGQREVSPWCRDQVVLLAEQEEARGSLGGGSWEALPPAARWP
jgi:isopentenyl-diphosphate delta-isomerase